MHPNARAAGPRSLREPPAARALRRLIALAAVVAAAFALRRAADHPSPRDVVAEYRAAAFGAEPPVQPSFRDVTAEVGIVALHDSAADGAYRIPEQMGPGVGIADFDGDGVLDLFVAGGGALPPDAPTQRAQLWMQAGGRFVEQAAARGAAVAGPAYGVACADYDDDGDVDVYVTRLGPNVLLENEGGGRFREVPRAAGLDDAGFGASAAFFDYDRDGDLDVYVVNYLDWSPERERECRSVGRRDYCGPMAYEAPAQDRLFENRGDGTFADVTARAGILGHLGNGLGVAALDVDSDGFEDLYVANDTTPAFLWRNRGDGTFEEVALAWNCAFNSSGVAIAGMGVAVEDLNDDARPDLVVTNFVDQSHLALLSRGGSYTDASQRLGLPRWSIPATGFGIALFDQDLDGRLDLYVTNGAVNISPATVGMRDPYAQQDQFARLVDGRFVDATRGSGASADSVGRGLATGDFDGDGDQDLVLTSNGGALSVLRNEQPGENAWLAVDVLRPSGSHALGAVVTVVSAGARQARVVRAHASYLSTSSPTVHFGLGAERSPVDVHVRWPDGVERALAGVPVDQVLEVRRD